ncbi:MAG: protein Mom [Paludibacter sp.]|nr:protein Mom [Paludibacter sp.]
MRLEKASGKAIKYACLNYHYAKSVPVIRLGYSVFNDNDEWCGVILYSSGANPRIAKEYGLVQGQVVELVRVALNGNQEHTSQALAMSLKILKQDAPAVKLVVSFADRNQDHIGTIYQATNWFYMDERSAERGIMIKGKLMHSRSVGRKYGNQQIEWIKHNIDPNAERIKGKTKIKYVYVLDKKLFPKIKELSKPYPKKEIKNNV